MPRRIQIYEQVELRQLPDDVAGPGKFGLYATNPDQPELTGFLKIKNEIIVLVRDDTLVLPARHKLDQINLMPRSEAGMPIAAAPPRLIIENHGQSVGLQGQDLAVMGNATVRVPAEILAGIDFHKRKQGVIAIDPAIAPQASNLEDARLHGHTLRYGDGRRITALSDGYKGQVTFVDNATGKNLLTLDVHNDGVDKNQMEQRLAHMQRGVALRLRTQRLAADQAVWDDAEKREEEARLRAAKHPFPIPAPTDVPDGRKKMDDGDEKISAEDLNKKFWEKLASGVGVFGPQAALDSARRELQEAMRKAKEGNADARESSAVQPPPKTLIAARLNEQGRTV